MPIKKITATLLSLSLALASSLPGLDLASAEEGALEPLGIFDISDFGIAEPEPEPQPEPREGEEPLFFEGSSLSSQPTVKQNQGQDAEQGKNKVKPLLDIEGLLSQEFVSLSSGQAQFSLPVATPKGMNGLTPSLALSYSSQLKDVRSHFGLGWEMFGGISRRSKTGLQDLYEHPTFTASFQNFQGDLVELSQGSEGGRDFVRYGFQQEGSFARVRFFTTSKHWEITANDGVVYRFGLTESAREQNAPADRIFAWQIEEIEDTHGNKVTYAWTKVDGMPYPSAITWGGSQGGADPFELRFVLEDDLDDSLDLKKGFFSKGFQQRIRGVELRVQGTLRFSYLFHYGQADYRLGSDLTSVVLTGTNLSGAS
ncbi:MAG: SpvB/TcaC N-terminal domain-containing protein, partial [bacterium]|nr:SpvB/TcaC N-terminal domain-containing protein [bacterium]